jgi:hypothetical protein
VAVLTRTVTANVCDGMSETGVVVELQQPVQRTVCESWTCGRGIHVVITRFINHTGRRDERIGLIEFAFSLLLLPCSHSGSSSDSSNEYS